MDRKQVEAIFETLKEEFLSSKVAVKNPVAYIFGGQPAVGKSNLEKKNRSLYLQYLIYQWR